VQKAIVMILDMEEGGRVVNHRHEKPEVSSEDDANTGGLRETG
jgi:hypothetical protein